MNKLSILLVSALIASGASVAHAQSSRVSAPESVPEYDQKDTENLNSQAGFVALDMGDEITEDNTERAAVGLEAVVPPAPVVGVEVIQQPAPAPVVGVLVEPVQEPAVEVTVEQVITGNTDTGVDLNKIKPQLDQAY